MAKKFTLILVLFALSLGVIIVPATTTYAAESPSTEYYNAQYDFSYEETVMPTKQIVRKYEKPETSIFSTNSTVNSATKTKAILASLGMGEDFIDALSNEQLNEYANSEFIMATEAFIKTDAEGNSTFVTESEAQEGSRGFVPPGASEDDLNDPGNPPTWYGTRTDEYMHLVLVVSYKGSAKYHISVDSEWLQAPLWYLIDTLGACAQDCSVVNSSRSGWYSYMQDDNTDDEGAYLVKYNFNNTVNHADCAFQNASNGNWHGAAAAFEYIPSVGTLTLYSFSEYKAHVEFDIEMLYPQLAKNFNVTATYAHSIYDVDFEPSIGIAVPAAVTIGLVNTEVEKTYKTVELPDTIHYEPD